ncbi:type II secretion system F family protein [Solicola gregarius]|uniref:Type II secretion system F family protein n=1 Tax=Solicola gregarius TaxID=2908642 RepID=A0AA46TEV6_9ACTN|nr:type II secretion system F family protein [Solicola gregarius]UYM04072.1 type II secretion system F family protein [Solicola gregarius]
MGVVIGLLFGLGLLLVWTAISDPEPEHQRRPRTPGLARLLRGAGVEGVTPVGVMLLCTACSVVVGFVILLVSQTWAVAVVFAAMAAYLPIAVLRARQARRRRERREVWPEVVDNLGSAVRAGLSLPEALVELGERGPVPLRDPFEKFALDYQASGRFNASLDLLKERLADPVGDRVVEGLRIARDVGGGDLGAMLRTLSSFLRDDLRTRGELESRQSWTVNGARLAVAAPWCILLLMSFQQDVVSRFSTGAGLVVLGVGASTCVVAYRLMIRLGRLPDERRTLA